MKGKWALGRAGEEAVCKYLSDKGHTIIERNWRAGHLEIDIITLAADGIHFVEVKTRTAPVSAEPQESVNALKMKNMALAANKYLSAEKVFSGSNLDVIFDVATVIYDGEKSDIRYFPNAFIPLFC